MKNEKNVEIEKLTHVQRVEILEREHMPVTKKGYGHMSVNTRLSNLEVKLKTYSDDRMLLPDLERLRELETWNVDEPESGE